jgi:hypothetical protein
LILSAAPSSSGRRCWAAILTSPPSPAAGTIKAQSPERAVIQLGIPGDWKTDDGVAFLDTGVTRVDFKVAGAPIGKAAGRGAAPAAPSVPRAATQPGRALSSRQAAVIVEAPATFVGEGDMQFRQLVMNIQRGLAGGAKAGEVMRKGRLVVTPDFVRFVQADQTVFEAATPSVREVAPISMMGQPTGVFRIVFKSGKIYNFMDQSEGGAEKGQAFKTVKKKLGK